MRTTYSQETLQIINTLQPLVEKAVRGWKQVSGVLSDFPKPKQTKQSDGIKIKKIHYILTGLSLTIILLSLNRLTPWTSTYLQPYEFLRWLDFNAMLPIPLLSIVLYYLLKEDIVYPHPFQKTWLFTALNITLIAGIYLFGTGSGDHEVTNYLHTRFCTTEVVSESMCNIIRFNDDDFSHWVYYAGFILMNVALMIFEYKLPRKEKISGRDLIGVTANGLFIALGIFANLAFEDIGLDLLFFGSMMMLALYLLFNSKYSARQLPVLHYFATSYSVGVLGTVIWKAVGF